MRNTTVTARPKISLSVKLDDGLVGLIAVLVLATLVAAVVLLVRLSVEDSVEKSEVVTTELVTSISEKKMLMVVNNLASL